MKQSEYVKIIKQDKINGEILDTVIELKGEFTIAGTDTEDFINELERLVGTFRI